MAPKRVVKEVAVFKNNNFNNLSLSDVICPICRSILIEPVTLPCNHVFCLACFEGTMANASLVCPLCRIRIGSWLRTYKRANKIVNSAFWDAIRHSFPQQVKNKLDGIDENFDEEVAIRLASPGEIRREYEAQKHKEDSEFKKRQQVEREASEALIRKLKVEEETELAAKREKLRLDEKVAKKLANEWNFDPGPSSSKAKTASKKLLNDGPHSKQKGQPQNSIKEYTSKVLCQEKSIPKCVITKINLHRKMDLSKEFIKDKLRKISAEVVTSDSSDLIDSECRYFKPIDFKHAPPSKAVPAIRIPSKIASATTVIIGAPLGLVEFKHNYVLSAFARVKFTPIPSTKDPLSCEAAILEIIGIKTPPVKVDSPIRKRQCTRQYSRSKGNVVTEEKVLHKNGADESVPKVRRSTRNHHLRNETDSSPEKTDLDNTPKRRKKSANSSPAKNQSPSVKWLRSVKNNVVSPPFYGFDNSQPGDKKMSPKKAKLNGIVKLCGEGNFTAKKLQEDSDWKLAQRLQEEFNRSAYSTRSSIMNFRNKRSARQVTLDELLSSK